ncbi:MAG: hypothetical protein A2Y17_04190 [Clostridiales bacterium GWF2_38_85]|nr:MAG: hypothetical protein A2Y17_04190 [Clostridiales bacterium GWF2_38_85]HBL83448.1 hypothetical protein [Clostridiales bacterium]
MKRSIFTLAISLFLCLSFIINANALLLDSTTFYCYANGTGRGWLYSDEYYDIWAVETYSTYTYDYITCKLEVLLESGGEFVTVINKEIPSARDVYDEYDSSSTVLWAKGYHAIRVYDFEQWLTYSGTTDY